MADKSYYAWSELRLGGESEMHLSATGVSRKIVVSREVVQPGEKVTKADLTKRGLTDEDWEAFLEGGSIREYPMPKMPASATQSPTDFVLSQLREGITDDIPQETAMALALGGSGGALVPAHLDTTGEAVKEVKPS